MGMPAAVLEEVIFMAKLSYQQIQDLGKRLILENDAGIRFSDLVEQIAAKNGETPRGTIQGAIVKLQSRFPDEIAKPQSG